MRQMEDNLKNFDGILAFSIVDEILWVIIFVYLNIFQILFGLYIFEIQHILF